MVNLRVDAKGSAVIVVQEMKSGKTNGSFECVGDTRSTVLGFLANLLVDRSSVKDIAGRT
jgi:hypothetical protein